MMIDKATRELLQTATEKLRIVDVFCRSLQCSVPDSYLPLYVEDKVAFQNRYFTAHHAVCRVGPNEAASAEGPVIVEYQVVGEARFLKEQDSVDDESTDDLAKKGALLGHISATFSAVYLWNECPDDALQAFGMRNVPLQVWPYWRELLQNTVARMRLPAVTLGMFVPDQGPQALANATDAESPATRSAVKDSTSS